MAQKWSLKWAEGPKIGLEPFSDPRDPVDEFTSSFFQVLSVIDMINRRRASSIIPGMQQTTQMAPSPMVGFLHLAVPQFHIFQFEEYLTPEVTFRTPARPEVSRERARTIAAMPTEDEISTEYKTPSLDDIRKQKQEELLRLRTESRARAASKTDAELGLGELASVKRNSLQFHVPSTPVTSRSYTVSPPTDRNKVNLQFLFSVKMFFLFSVKIRAAAPVKSRQLRALNN